MAAKEKEFDDGLREISLDAFAKATLVNDEAQSKIAQIRIDKQKSEKALEDKLVSEILGTI